MTYKQLKSSCSVLLTGDRALPKDNEDFLAALNMAYIEISNKATALKLLGTSKEDAIRLGPGNTYVRMPKLPVRDDEELDVDNELGPALARIIASYISKDNGKMHISIAYSLIRDYEAKVQTFIDKEINEALDKER